MTINQQRAQLKDKIVGLAANDHIEAVALEVFRYQAANNPLYHKFIELLGKKPAHISRFDDIPFLPISFFKTYRIRTANWQAALEFSSSGTSGQQTSRHLLREPDWYRIHARQGFTHFYGPLRDCCFLALLPSYLERQGSSLIFMVEDFIQQSSDVGSGFFLNEFEELSQRLQASRNSDKTTVLIGVSFALLDFAEQYPQDLSGVTIMETGGMKGRRKEITREELHQQLQSAFKVSSVHSEYGMTELFSQAYSKGGGRFYPSPGMKVVAREITDPLAIQKTGKTGALNIVDLANLDTISFIATDDLGRCYADGSFEVLGRLDNSDVRGCNLMVV